VDIDQLVLEAWKKTIDVQQHFNTIQMQIRGTAVTVVTAAVAAAGVLKGQEVTAAIEAMKMNKPVVLPTAHVLGLQLSPPTLIVAAGLVAWIAFWSIDRLWYHRLLRGAVEHGETLEDLLGNEKAVILGLTKKISETSRFKSPLTGKKVNAGRRLNWFYALVGIVLCAIAAALAL
jgi:hypothetical protein